MRVSHTLVASLDSLILAEKSGAILSQFWQLQVAHEGLAAGAFQLETQAQLTSQSERLLFNSDAPLQK